MPRASRNKNIYGFTKTEQLQQDVARLAKVANTRLRALEKAGYAQSSRSYHWVEGKADRGKSEFLDMTKGGQFKFKTKVKNRSYQQLQAEKHYLEVFLSKESSTVGGIKKIHQKRYESFKKKMGSDMTFKEYTELVEGDVFEWAVKQFGSDEVRYIIKHKGTSGAAQIFTELKAMPSQYWTITYLHERAFGTGEDYDLNDVMADAEDLTQDGLYDLPFD